MDARAWAKKVEANPEESKALVRLGKLEPSDKPGRVKVPFPVSPEKSPYDKVIGHKSLQKRIADAPVKDVPVSKIHSNGQKSVRVDQVEHYIGDPDATPHSHGGKHPVDHPIIVKVGGKSYAYDGHHRVTAATLRGEKSIKARFVDLDGPAPKK
jgi:hypothetical protein